MSTNTDGHKMVGEKASLDKQMLQIHLSVAGVSFSSTLFTSRPVTTAFAKWQFQLYVFVLGLFLLTPPVGHWREVFRGSTREGRMWKFSIFELRSAPLSELHQYHASGSFTVKYGGVALISGPHSLNHDGSEAVIELAGEGASVADEWCFRTDATNASRDPVRFSLHRSHDNSQSWEAVGSSVSFIDTMGGMAHHGGFFDTRDERGKRLANRCPAE